MQTTSSRCPVAIPVDHIRGLHLSYSVADQQWYRQAGPENDPSSLLVPYEADQPTVEMSAYLAWRLGED